MLYLYNKNRLGSCAYLCIFVVYFLMYMQNPSPKLNEVQISLLRLFSREMSESDTLSLKRVLVQHYNQLLMQEVSEVVQAKGYTQTDFDKLLHQG